MATKEEKIKLSERVKVYGTGKDEKNMPKGSEWMVHPVLAKKLEAKGVATTKAVKES